MILKSTKINSSEKVKLIEILNENKVISFIYTDNLIKFNYDNLDIEIIIDIYSIHFLFVKY